ncbi:MAG: hypothetical protein KGI56_10945, partial [Acidobacteriota bacterium]|nr:hypothetical protein [Acidobacteriota bacterium]
MALRTFNRISAAALLLTGGMAFIGCGGGSSSAAMGTGTGTPTSTASTAMQVAIGDAPSDWIMAFGMTVNSITLTNSAGGTVSVMPTSTPTEMMQLM